MKFTFIILFALLIGYALIRPFSSIFPRLFLLFGSILGLLSVVGEEYTNYLANIVGISRAADLYLYLGLVTIFLYIYFTLMKFRSLENRINKIAQHVANPDNYSHTKKSVDGK